ncbi:hypothetical protein IEI94_05700 [Halomonas sp. ML-15]|uniref:hypothetical protein n=1 Tax=Halomonas sp. ML-15 TaxID=2773305 RepID=UPI00174652B6|nr:hypothetical protein [Halomonas sp. ML-15]MBD3895340.1 hypothetical protein [Halomonas sp. ML-15]
MSSEEEKAVLKELDFECPSCGSCFCEESQWVANLIEFKTATCPDCSSELAMGEEDESRLVEFMKKKERFGKAMFVFMLPYMIGGLAVSLYFGGLGFMLYMPVGIAGFALLKVLFDNQSDMTVRFNLSE